MTTLNRFITSTTNWWADFRWAKPGVFTLSILVLLSCQDNTGDVGFKNPNGDFQVFVKEFTLPTKTFLMDSVNTSYGWQTTGVKTTSPNRFMVGHAEDPVFGKTTATAYTQFYAATFPFVDVNAVFLDLKLTLVYDFYWYGSKEESDMTLDVYDLADSMITYRPHYSSESQPLGQLLGSITRKVNPATFDEDVVANTNDDTSDDLIDSVQISMDNTYGRKLFALAMDTVGLGDENFNLFYRFRKIFKGLAIKSPNANKIVGFDIENLKTRMVLDYRIDTTKYQLVFYLSASGQQVGAPEFVSYTQLETDRSGTPLAGLTTKYQDFEAPSGMNYIQAGTGVATKLDFSEVIEHFKDVPVKALSVAELRIDSDEQPYAPTSFLLRAIKPNNRDIRTSATLIDVAQDPFTTVDGDFLSKHIISTGGDGGYGSPWYQAEVTGDEGSLFYLLQASNTNGSSLYSGYLTNYMQQEVGLSEADFLRYYALIPTGPAMSRGVNGFYFPHDKVKLKIYYTTPRSKN